MFTFPNVLDLFVDELSGLRGGSFSLTGSLSSTLSSFLFGHIHLLRRPLQLGFHRTGGTACTTAEVIRIAAPSPGRGEPHGARGPRLQRDQPRLASTLLQ